MNFDPQGTDCEECVEANRFENDDPPCGDCGRPQFLFPGNQKIIDLWTICHRLREESAGMGGVIPLKLKASEITAVCGAYGADLDDFEGVLSVEAAAYGFVVQRYKEQG